MSSDLRAALLRRHKPDKRRAQRRPRPRDRLVGAAAGTLPKAAHLLVERSLLLHCLVCLAELAVGVANLDPASSAWRQVRDLYAVLFDAVPVGRLLTPDDRTCIDAGSIAGMHASGIFRNTSARNASTTPRSS